MTAPTVDAPPAATNGHGVTGRVLVELPLDQLVPSPHNPRRDLGDLKGLAESMRTVGVLEPLLVEPLGDGRYVIRAGHRRQGAARLAGLATVPCVVAERLSDDATALQVALIENLQRSGLEPLDEAEGYQALVKLGLSQRRIADQVGCSQSHVSKRLGLLELPAHVRARIEKGTLPLEAAAALLRLKDHPGHLKRVAGFSPESIVRGVEQAERQITLEDKIAKLTADAKAKGWKVFTEPSWGAKRAYKTIEDWNGPPEIAVEGKAHRAEPCHAVMVPSAEHYYGYGRGPTATAVCTEPARHGPKGGSSLKAKPKPKAQPSARDRQLLIDDRERKASAEARTAVLTKAVRAHRARRTSPAVELCLREVLRVDRYGHDVVRTACELVGAHAVGDLKGQWQNWHEALRTFAADSDDAFHQAALAAVLAVTETNLRSAWGSWCGPGVDGLFAFLEAAGYEPSPWERTQLDDARKAGAED